MRHDEHAQFAIGPNIKNVLQELNTRASAFSQLASDPVLDFVKLLDEQRAGGSAISVGFLRTFVASEPLVSPEIFDVCPVLLVHPADGRWTDVAISRAFFEQLNVPKRLVMLRHAGHFPIEQPGAGELRTAVLDFLAERNQR